MLLKLKAKLGETTSTVMIRRDAINAIVPQEDCVHVYINNIATPLQVLADIDQLESFLGKVFHEGVLKHTDMERTATITQPSFNS